MRGNATASAAPHPPLRGTLSPQAGRGEGDRLLLCWDLLVEQAATGRTITYSDFAPKLSVAPLGIGRWLTPPLHWCRRYGLPDLPIIVVSKSTGRPRGDYHDETIAAETVRVFAFDWAAVERPDLAVLLPARGEKVARRAG